jgi:hypothetical protein
VAGRRDYGKIAENLAILGAHASGLGVPIAPGMALYRSLRRKPIPVEDNDFVERFLNGIESWCHVPERRRFIDELGGLRSLWGEHLTDRLGEAPAVGRPEAIHGGQSTGMT